MLTIDRGHDDFDGFGSTVADLPDAPQAGPGVRRALSRIRSTQRLDRNAPEENADATRSLLGNANRS